jgi:hypothetical protein
MVSDGEEAHGHRADRSKGSRHVSSASAQLTLWAVVTQLALLLAAVLSLSAAGTHARAGAECAPVEDRLAAAADPRHRSLAVMVGIAGAAAVLLVAHGAIVSRSATAFVAGWFVITGFGARWLSRRVMLLPTAIIQSASLPGGAAA